MKKKIDEQSRMLFYLLKKNSTYNDILHDTSKNIQDVFEDISALQKGFESYIIKEEENSKRKIMPTPELSEMISKTIKEQITFELAMLDNVKIVNRDIINKITYNTSRTYPYVDIEYISKKCLTIINSLQSPNKSD